MAERATPLNTLSVRRGEARPTDPNTATNMAEEAAQMVDLVETAIRSPHALRRAPRRSDEKVQLNSRVPLRLKEGLSAVAFLMRRSEQDLLAEFLEEGLTKCNPNWTSFLS